MKYLVLFLGIVLVGFEKPILETKSTSIAEYSKNTSLKKIQVPIVFTVQIAALKNTNSDLEKLEDVSIYIEDTLVKFRLGAFATYKEARNYRLLILKKYPGAFVQALKNGKRIPIREAIKQQLQNRV